MFIIGVLAVIGFWKVITAINPILRLFVIVPIRRLLDKLNDYVISLLRFASSKEVNGDGRRGASERHYKLKKRYSSSLPSHNAWALISGSTDGIGLEYARKLAALHFNLIMIGRNEEKLNKCSSSIKGANPDIKILQICCDAKDLEGMQRGISEIVERTKKIDLSILINNVGIGQGGRKKLEYLEEEDVKDCIVVNCLFPTLLTKALLPSLKRHIGPKLIINMSSVAALVMNPLSAVYCATKAFNRQFSIALTSEYRENGIDSLAVMPGFVSTPMTGMEPSLLCCRADECVDAVFDWVIDQSSLGLNDILEVVPHWKHQLMYYFLKVLTASIPSFWRAKATYTMVHWFRSRGSRKD